MTTIAVYSRKSVFTGKGESIENQIELCKNYCETYLLEKDLNYIIYEDEGFSGKNINRPQFKKLIKDIKSNKINTLICYRLDRISRNVADFSSTLELLQKHNVSFISIKERFDTTTPLGRAMIYIASVFAQLERETLAERVRDNMIQLSKTGRWLGGSLPLGFNVEKVTYLNDEMKEKTLSKLVPNESELNTVKFIYDTYLKVHSVRDTTRQLNLNLFKGKNGGNFDLTQTRRILRNPMYVISDDDTHNYLKNRGMNVYGTPNGNGYLTYNKRKQSCISTDVEDWIVTVSNHKGIIASDQWLNIQLILDDNKEKQSRIGTGKSNSALFSGLLKCSKCGGNMVVKLSGRNANNNNLPYEYYVCSNKMNKYVNKCTTKNIPVEKLDSVLISKIKTENNEILKKTLEKSVDSIEKDLLNEEVKDIKAQISEKESSVSNLIKQLSKSKSESISDRLMKELNDLDTEIKQLKNRLTLLDKQKSINVNKNNNILELMNALEHFDKTIDLIDDITQKRFLIQSIVESASWDSDTNDVEIKLSSRKNRQFIDGGKSMDCNLYSSKG